MANATADYGFTPVKAYSGELRQIRCAVAAGYGTALFVGDPVSLDGSGFNGRPTVRVAPDDTSTVMIFGVIVGFEATGPDSLTTLHSLASTADTVIVQPTLPGVVFRVNTSGATGASQNDIGLRFDHVATAGTALTGRSNYALDMGDDATAGSATSNGWLLIGFDDRPDNEYSTTLATDTINIDLLVTCVESSWANGNGVA